MRFLKIHNISDKIFHSFASNIKFQKIFIVSIIHYLTKQTHKFTCLMTKSSLVLHYVVVILSSDFILCWLNLVRIIIFNTIYFSNWVLKVAEIERSFPQMGQTTATTLLTVYVSDLNDNPPRFNQPFYFAYLEDTAQLNHPLKFENKTRITVMDVDQVKKVEVTQRKLVLVFLIHIDIFCCDTSFFPLWKFSLMFCIRTKLQINKSTNVLIINLYMSNLKISGMLFTGRFVHCYKHSVVVLIYLSDLNYILAFAFSFV